MRVSIAAKVMALVIASVVATVGIIQAVAYVSVRDGYEAVTAQAVKSYLNVIDSQIVTYKESYADMARTQAGRPNVIDAVLAGDTTKLRDLGKTLMAGGKADLVVFTNAKADVVARAHNDKAGDNIGNQEGVKRALAGEACAVFESGNVVRFSIRAYAPIKKDGAVVGVVIVGQDLSNNSALVDGVKKAWGPRPPFFTATSASPPPWSRTASAPWAPSWKTRPSSTRCCARARPIWARTPCSAASTAPPTRRSKTAPTSSA